MERAKAFDIEGNLSGVRAARVAETGRRLGILSKGAAYSEGNGWTRFRSQEKTAVATGSRTNLRDHTKTILALFRPRDSTTDKAEGPAAEEELGHDKPSEILGLEHTQRKTKHAFWLVGADTLL
jgi:hypothetical protein